MVSTERFTGVPPVAELVAVVREALAAEVVPVTGGREQYVVRMACRLLEVVERELTDDTPVASLQLLLEDLDVSSESDLAAGLLNSKFSPDDARVRSIVSLLVRHRVGIARPDRLEAS